MVVVVVKVIVMKKKSKITLANGLTVLAAFATFMCLFAINGITLQTVIALAAAFGCAYLTACFFNVETILRKQRAAQLRKAKQNNARKTLAVVRCAENQAA